jgi:peptidoglycan/xylan/chitin deacetylase (PgdA/CDA1 family)
VPNGQRIPTANAGSFTFSVTARDARGNTSIKQVAYTIAGGDTTRPTITVTSPTPATTYAVDQSVTAQYACADTGGSGLKSCVGSVPSGTRLDTSQAGAYLFRVDASDGAGNTQTMTVSYSIEATPSPGACPGGYYGLTFDDGPNTVYTRPLLTTLDSLGVKATFFLVGQEVDAAPELARLEVSAGHAVGNHTFTHPDLTQLSSAQVSDQISRTNDAIRRATGIAPQFVRPPYGEFNTQTVSVFKSFGLENTIWTIDTNDWQGLSVSRIVSEAVKVQPGGIILMHDAYPNTVTAVPQIVNQLKQKGMCPGRLALSPTPVEAVPAWPGLFFSVVAVRP